MVWKLVVALLVVFLGREKRGPEHALQRAARQAWDEYRRLPWYDKI